jgi:hypothetical protein
MSLLRIARRKGGGAGRTIPIDRPMTAGPTTRMGARRRRRLALRHLWLVPGLGLALYANAQAEQHGLGLVPLLVFGIVPHLTVLAGVGQPRARGQLAPRAVPLFNALHHPLPPLSMVGLAAIGVLPPFWFAGALAWLSHIVVDWAFGDGLRSNDGFVRRGWIDNRRLGSEPRPVGLSFDGASADL